MPPPNQGVVFLILTPIMLPLLGRAKIEDEPGRASTHILICFHLSGILAEGLKNQSESITI